MTVDDLKAELKACPSGTAVKIRFVRDPAIDTETLYDIGYVAIDGEEVVLEAFSDVADR